MPFHHLNYEINNNFIINIIVEIDSERALGSTKKTVKGILHSR